MTNNRHIPSCISAAVLNCGRQIIALRDDGEIGTGDVNVTSLPC